MWGTTPLQRLRLGPLYCALRIADALERPKPRQTMPPRSDWRPGISVVIPDRDAPSMLSEALASVMTALERVDEPHQIVVVANGAAADAYSSVLARFQSVEFVHSVEPLGFSTAIARGLASARHDWTFLMNNDVTLDADALRHLAALRDPKRFSLSAQIFQRSSDGCREETGFTDWYADAAGVRVYHAAAPPNDRPRPHLAGSGGATLFRTQSLKRYVGDSRCYDPFYWEDIEWGVRAWSDGYDVMFCPSAHAFHRHRVTTSRYFETVEIDRIVERNALLFDARNRASTFGLDWLMGRICDQTYMTQRELARLSTAAIVLRARVRSARGGPIAPPVLTDPHRAVSELAPASFSYRLRDADDVARPRVLVVTPFAVFPPRHGGARRIAGLLAELRSDHDIVLVTDEASLYDARSFAWFDGLRAVYLVQRDRESQIDALATLEARMRTHVHASLRDAVAQAIAHHRPSIVQIEYAELADLVRLRGERECWILDLHDAYGAGDFATADDARRFEGGTLFSYDAVIVCSDEDRALVTHGKTIGVPNGSSIALQGYRPSDSTQMLFMGPFRYAQNLDGIRRFLTDAYSAVRRAVPDATLLVLGGDGAPRRVKGDPAFEQPGVAVLAHRDDVRALLDASALTINPLAGIRGSSIKVVESLSAGRICVTTAAGARGFAHEGLQGLVVVDDVGAMAAPLIELLRHVNERHRIEPPDATRLARYQWAHSAELVRGLYRDLLRARRG